MNVDQVHGFLLIFLGLFTHGISVPVPSSYFINEAPNQGLPVDDITQPSESYERVPRNSFSSPYNYVHENRWFPRSQVSARPRRPARRHFHLFHLTAKHPNAVSYHVIQKPLVPRTISAPVKYKGNSRSNVLYNKRQYQPATPSYYQQPATYQYPAYSSSNSPYGQNRVQNSMYQDIYQEVSNPMQFPSNPSPYTNQQTSVMQNDNTLEEAAKQFTRISADMNNMELASLVMYPVPRLPESHPTKIHKKKHKSKSKRKNKKNKKKKKKNKSKVSKIELERKAKTVKNLLHTLIKNDKDTSKDNDDMRYDGSGSADSWDEEDVPNTRGQGYTSGKRSEIPHVIDTISNSDEDKTESFGDDASSDKHELDGASGKQESELGGGYVNKDDVKDDDSHNKKPQADVEETEDDEGSGSGSLQNENDDDESGGQESEVGSGYVNESDVEDDDDSDEKKDDDSDERKNDDSDEEKNDDSDGGKNDDSDEKKNSEKKPIIKKSDDRKG